jgi:hypothetical protein
MDAYLINSDSQRGNISSNHQLSRGDSVEAYYRGTLVRRGEVTDLAPDHGLFWIHDVLSGGRRLLDIAELEIRKSASHAHSQLT